jgi:hypothetical protein
LVKINYLRVIRLSIASMTRSNPSRTASVVAVTAASTAAAAFFRATFSLALTFLPADLIFLPDDFFSVFVVGSSVRVYSPTRPGPPVYPGWRSW